MSLAELKSDNTAMFPTLDAVQIARLEGYGHRRKAAAGEILFDQGEASSGVYVVISGSLEIVNPLRPTEPPIAVHGPGQFSGEINTLSGRNTLLRGVAPVESELIEIDLEHLRQIVQNDPELSEVFLRAFVLRRVALVRPTPGDVLLRGTSHSSDTLRLREFLSRNGHPYQYLDVDRDADVQSVLDHFAVTVHDIPVIICRGTRVLRNPSNELTAECLGFNANVDEQAIVDVIVVGGGAERTGGGGVCGVGRARCSRCRDQRARRPGGDEFPH